MSSARRVLAAHGQAGVRRALAIRRTSAVRNANRSLAAFMVLAGLFVLAALADTRQRKLVG